MNCSRDEQWTLSQTGNWHGNLRDLDGDGAYDDVGDEDLTAFTYNVANEWTARTITIGTGGGTSTTGYTRAHDAVGNLIDDGEDYEYVYDPFGRLRFVKRTDNQAVVAEYRYNGLGFRVGWHYDVDADGTVENTSDDPWFFFAYDEGWRMVATYRSTDSSPKEQFVHHMAGLGGYGGSSYIDAVILRERDANTAWASAADGTLEERRYICQNWRADVVAIVTSAGKLVERVRYSAYGIPTAFPAGDTDTDGDWDASDSTDIGLNYTPGSAYAVRRDTDLDGDVDANDVTHANSITGGYQTLGRDVLTSAAVRNRIGYAGYQYDPTFAGVDRHLFHVRHRVYDAELGRWTRRDPLGYVDGVSLYEYVRSMPLKYYDPRGLGCQAPMNAGGCVGPIPMDPAIPWYPRYPGIPHPMPGKPRPLPSRCPLPPDWPWPFPDTPRPKDYNPYTQTPRSMCRYEIDNRYRQIRYDPRAALNPQCAERARESGYACCNNIATGSNCAEMFSAVYAECVASTLRPPPVAPPRAPMDLPYGLPPSIVFDPDTGEPFDCMAACDRQKAFYLALCDIVPGDMLPHLCQARANLLAMACQACCLTDPGTLYHRWKHCLDEFAEAMETEVWPDGR